MISVRYFWSSCDFCQIFLIDKRCSMRIFWPPLPAPHPHPIGQTVKKILVDLSISWNFLHIWFRCTFWLPPPPTLTKQRKKKLTGVCNMDNFCMVVFGGEYVTTYCWHPRGFLLVAAFTCIVEFSLSSMTHGVAMLYCGLLFCTSCNNYQIFCEHHCFRGQSWKDFFNVIMFWISGQIAWRCVLSEYL